MARLLSVVCVGLGLLALVYGEFTYETAARERALGLRAEERGINAPVWVGVTLAILGGGLLGQDRRGRGRTS